MLARGDGELDALGVREVVEVEGGVRAWSAPAAPEAEDEVQGALLLYVVVVEGAAVLELLAGEDEALLVGGHALLVLDLALDHFDGVGGLDLERDGLAGERLDEDLHVGVRCVSFIAFGRLTRGTRGARARTARRRGGGRGGGCARPCRGGPSARRGGGAWP